MDQRITLISRGVADLDRAIRFYRDGLGRVPSGSSREGEVAFFQLNGLVLGLWRRHLLAEDARVVDGGGWGGITLAQNRRSREEVDAAVAAAVVAGGSLTLPGSQGSRPAAAGRLAERAGFEPAMGCPIPHFQCGALGH
jgi:catechol 2,3-dioxygenase-like lactoylglutathione lyase family enzyme